MKDVIDAIGTRIKSPYFGYSLFAFVTLNWRALFLLFVSDIDPAARIVEFDNQTSIYSLVLAPLAFGFSVAVLTPWIKVVFEFISRKPYELIDINKINAQHVIAIKQVELEKIRNDLFAERERELIERAKRDETVSEISDESTKENLALEISRLREQRNQLDISGVDDIPLTKKLSREALEIISEASRSKDGAIRVLDELSGRSILVGKKQYGLNNPMKLSRYEDALDQLIIENLIKSQKTESGLYFLTKQGWDEGTKNNES